MLLYGWMLFVTTVYSTTCVECQRGPCVSTRTPSPSIRARPVAPRLESPFISVVYGKRPIEDVNNPTVAPIVKKPSSPTLHHVNSMDEKAASDAAAFFRGDTPWSRDAKSRNSMKHFYLKGLTSSAALPSEGAMRLMVMSRLGTLIADHPNVIGGIRAYRAGHYQKTQAAL